MAWVTPLDCLPWWVFNFEFLSLCADTGLPAQVRERGAQVDSLYRVHVGVAATVAALHPRVAAILGNLQHSFLLLWPLKVDARGVQRHEGRLPGRWAHHQAARW